MATHKHNLFVSYAQDDLDRVLPLVEAVRRELDFRALPVEVWMDMSHLRPGEQWEIAITQALESSIGFIFFVSPRSLRSEWVRHELDMASVSSDRLIIPVILERPAKMPPVLLKLKGLDLPGEPVAEDIAAAAQEIADVVQAYLLVTKRPRAAVSKAEAPAIAATLAQQARAPVETAATDAKQNSVFVVHGHNTQALAMLEEYLASVGIAAVVLSRQDQSPQSLFQKFMSVATQARFAIVLLGADDYGAPRRQYDVVGVGDKSLQFRARQNVVLELGFFYGRLGWESVFVVYQEPDRVFPNFERPSDLDGVVFDSISDVAWQKGLSARLAAAGFQLSAST